MKGFEIHKNDEFARELAEGLSYSIAYVDEKSQIKLLTLIKKRDHSSINLPGQRENKNMTADFIYINETFSTPIIPNYNSSVIGETHEITNQPSDSASLYVSIQRTKRLYHCLQPHHPFQ